MNEPATKADVEQLRTEMHQRFEQTDRTVEGMRSQNSHEHGSIFSKLLSLTEIVHWIRAKFDRFTRMPDPNDKPP